MFFFNEIKNFIEDEFYFIFCLFIFFVCLVYIKYFSDCVCNVWYIFEIFNNNCGNLYISIFFFKENLVIYIICLYL